MYRQERKERNKDLYTNYDFYEQEFYRPIVTPFELEIALIRHD
jgi:hypothetical protein